MLEIKSLVAFAVGESPISRNRAVYETIEGCRILLHPRRELQRDAARHETGASA
jgi:hypothetical protein